jgi:hypothetical protein
MKQVAKLQGGLSPIANMRMHKMRACHFLKSPTRKG